MTREEAWSRIDAIIEKHEVDDVYVTINNHKDYDALRFARKLLEQEPCEDAKAHSKKEKGRPVVLPYRERKCRRCKYGDAYELQKPCIVYSESCELFVEKE